MSDQSVIFTIDGKLCRAIPGTPLIDAAAKNGVYIPHLCYRSKHKVTATCRLCLVKTQGRVSTACSTTVQEGLEVVLDDEQLNDNRKAMVELLFVEGEHFCPGCEKSGNCDLQAMASRMQMMRSRFINHSHRRNIDYSSKRIILEKNRCIHCRRCVEDIRTSDGKKVFAFHGRGEKLMIGYDAELIKTVSDDLLKEASQLCPVGCILFRGQGFAVPIGKRTYDRDVIGSTPESVNQRLEGSHNA